METESDLELLRRHVPVVRFDSRELFFPIPVDGYIRASSLLDADGTDLGGPGELEEKQLDRRLPDGSYLRFVSEAERRAVVRAEVRRVARRLFGPRLGRVGLFGRILDALFLLSLFFRPTTPRLTTVAAALKVERLGLQSRPVVYGRVVEESGWLVLHYAYFYAMNDWRSSYRGLNDHEADWEQAWVLCDPVDQTPVWVVASSHENRGPDLRRHWDDPECQRIGQRPVLYAGAGSHAFFFRPGDYVTRIDVAGLRWLLRLQRWIQQGLRITDLAAERGLGPALGVPFVDTATGDGREIADWRIEPLDSDRPSIGAFRGLWGLDTGDPTNGERGPSGPKFDRDGKIRQSWADPIGFAGLHGTSPPAAASPDRRLTIIDRTLDELEREITSTSSLLRLSPETAAPSQFQRESRRLSDLYRQRTELEDHRARLLAGEWTVPGRRAHLSNPAVPLEPPASAGWLLALWAAGSVPLLLASVAALFLLNSFGLSTLFLATAAGFPILEQLVRRHFQAVLRLLVVYVVVAGAFVLTGALFAGVLTVSRLAAGGVIAVAALALFVVNLGELTAVQRRAEAAAEDQVERKPGPT